jgi:hypothetical protein
MTFIERFVEHRALKNLQPQLVGFGNKFPKKECVVPIGNDCFRSADSYLCVAIDIRFDNEVRISILHQYIQRPNDPIEKTNEVGMAWISKNCNTQIDNRTNPMNDDNERVVLWKKIE